MHSLREVEMGMREGRRGIYKMRERDKLKERYMEIKK